MRRAQFDRSHVLELHGASETAQAWPTLSRTAAEHLASHERESGKATAGGWYGSTREQATSLLEQGDAAGAERALSLAAQVDEATRDVAPRDTRRRPRWSEDDGQDVDVDRLRAGAPFWRDMFRCAPAVGQGVHLVAHNSASAGKSPEQIVWNGALAVALCDVLERAGIPCAVSSATYCTFGGWMGGSGMGLVLVRAKASNEALNTDALAGILSGPVFRHQLLGHIFRSAPDPNASAGTPTHVSVAPPALLEWIDDGSKGIYLPAVYSQRDAIQAARGVLQSFNATDTKFGVHGYAGGL